MFVTLFHAGAHASEITFTNKQGSKLRCSCGCGYTTLRKYAKIFKKIRLLRYYIAAYCGCGMDCNSNITAAIAVADCNLEPWYLVS